MAKTKITAENKTETIETPIIEESSVAFDFENHVFNGQYWEELNPVPFNFENHVFNGQYWEEKYK